MNHKSGFVNILGNPNVGKSTIMNALVGEKLSIVTSKAQTTRHRIMGIVNGDDFQIVYSDTPGILQPRYKLQEAMMAFVHTALQDADIILYVTDVTEKPLSEKNYLEKIKTSGIPVIVVINKIDLSNQNDLDLLAEIWKKVFPYSTIIPVSALKKFNLDTLLRAIISYLPESPPYFPKDQLTDKYERFLHRKYYARKYLFTIRKKYLIPLKLKLKALWKKQALLGSVA